MKKRKFNLLLQIATLCLCVAAIAFGVYSAKTASLNVSGTVGFTAHNCELQVSGTKKGYAINEAGTSYRQTAEPLIKDAEGNATTAIVSTSGTTGSISTLPIGDLKFTDMATEEIPPIVITLTFTNLSAFKVSATVLVDDIDNVLYTRQYVKNDGIDLEGLANHVEAVILAPTTDEDKTVTFVITLKVADPEKNVTDLSSLNITANFAKYDENLSTAEFVENNVKYTLNGNRTAYSVTGNSLSSNTNVTIPAFLNGLPVTSTEAAPFENCSYLTGITIPNSVINLGDFYGCTNLKSVILPGSITSIPVYAFNGCSSLSNITIPNGVPTIDAYAFANCTSLTSITIPSSVTSISSYAFQGCTGLTNITIPSSVTSIGIRAFDGCTSLTSITIPANVTSIGFRAFFGCSNLTSVTFKTTEGWWYTDNSLATSGTPLSSTDLANTSTAVTYLTKPSSGGGYVDYDWKRG